MSTRVYLSKHTCQTTPEEETPVCLRIQLRRATVNDLHSCLQHAYQRDDVRLVRRITVLLNLLGHHVPVEALRAQWGPASPGSTTGVRPFCCGAWTAWALTMAVGADRSGPHARKNAWWSCWRLGRRSWAARPPVGRPRASECCSGGSSACSTTASTCVRCCTTSAFRFKRRVLSRTISTRLGGTPGSRRNGP